MNPGKSMKNHSKRFKTAKPPSLKKERPRRVEAHRSENFDLKKPADQIFTDLLAHIASAHPRKGSELIDLLKKGDMNAVLEWADALSAQSYADASQHFEAHQFSLLIRKYPFSAGKINIDPEAVAKKKFISTELRCKRINAKHRLLEIDRERDRFKAEIGIARRWIASVIGRRYPYGEVSRNCDFGPGASIGVGGSATNALRKLSSELKTLNPGALHHAFGGVMRDHHLLEAYCLERGGIVCYDPIRAFDKFVKECDFVDYNKISFVPKTAKTHRVIAVEPLWNGYYQTGIDASLKLRLKRVGIDLSDQTLNQELARKGSLDDSDDGFVTIDLESASDSISTELVRRLLPDEWFYNLNRTRSPNFMLDGIKTPYEKFCSMGNGFCFPLETLIFASAAHAVGSGVPGVDFAVYGDDIVVRKRFAARLIELLAHWGFKTNRRKTFLEGPFRESCGADWYNGADVRPFTLDYALRRSTDAFKFLNLTRRSERTEMFFSESRKVVLSVIDQREKFWRPLPGNPESAITTTGDEHLSCPTCHYVPSLGRWRWREIRSVPKVDFAVYGVSSSAMLARVMLRGTGPVPYGTWAGYPEVVFRRRTKTKVAWESYASVSNWTPQ